MKHPCILAALAIGLVVPILPARAQTNDENSVKCYDEDLATSHPDAVIGACTALIQSGGQSAENLSNVSHPWRCLR
ncbi:MAG TPA: hypothetical protein VGF56_06865 [Rhizomicrobium sp.]|jgi:hypothetical protein